MGRRACPAITATEGFAFALETQRPGLDRPSSPGGVEPDGAGPRMVPATGHVRVEGPGAAGARLDLAAAWLPWLWVVGSPLTFLWLACGLMGAERLRRRSRLLADRESAELCGGSRGPWGSPAAWAWPRATGSRRRSWSGSSAP